MCKNTTPHQRSVGSCIFIAKIIKNRTIDEVISKSQGLNGVYPKIDVPPSFPFGLFSHHSVRGNSLQDYPSFAGETVGTRIDRDNSLIMSLRLRGGYATTRRRRLYYAHKGSRTAKTSELVLAYQR